MGNQYRAGARTSAIVFIIVFLIALLFSAEGAVRLEKLFFLVSEIVAFFWFYYYAKAKGYSGWLALLGFLNLIGFIIILLLPNRNRPAAV